MSLAQKTAAEYSYTVQPGFRVRFHVGRRRGESAAVTLVGVHNLTSGAVYTVRLIEGEKAQCSCPDYTRRCAGTRDRICKHCRSAIIETENLIGPKAPFNVEQEARYAQALKDRELWNQ